MRKFRQFLLSASSFVRKAAFSFFSFSSSFLLVSITSILSLNFSLFSEVCFLISSLYLLTCSWTSRNSRSFVALTSTSSCRSFFSFILWSSNHLILLRYLAPRKRAWILVAALAFFLPFFLFLLFTQIKICLFQSPHFFLLLLHTLSFQSHFILKFSPFCFVFIYPVLCCRSLLQPTRFLSFCSVFCFFLLLESLGFSGSFFCFSSICFFLELRCLSLLNFFFHSQQLSF
mmetsp:Transcript_28226/g.59060  ORF Transcript_28226/g.59060 Transcript_28226/m.59060 type:complete len:230 (-) Transcript_28226:442-1131(-)